MLQELPTSFGISFPCIVCTKSFFYKLFSQNSFRGSLEISLSTGRNAGRGKVAYSWISPDRTKAGPTLGVVVVVVVVVVDLSTQSKSIPSKSRLGNVIRTLLY